MKSLVIPLLVVGLTGTVLGDDSDDTLKFYLSKAELVVAGTIITEPFGVISESGVPNYICEFEVLKTLKGQPPKEKQIKVNIIRFEMGKEDHSPLLKKGSKCILFLKFTSNNFPRWETADMWFGLQQYSKSMILSLKRLEKQRLEKETKPGYFQVKPNKENIIAGRLVGKWKLEATLTTRLSGKSVATGVKAVRPWVLFQNARYVVEEIPAKYEEFLGDKQIYQAGIMMLPKDKKYPFILIELNGNPHIVYFRERGGNRYGDAESFNLMFAAAKNPNKDMLFIGGDFSGEPFTAYERDI